MSDLGEQTDLDGGENQRLYLHVPNPPTTMTLGYEIPGKNGASGEAGEGIPSGFGVWTERHIALQADQTLTFQAKQQVWLRSETKGYLTTRNAGDSSGVVSAVAGGGVYAMAGSSVLIGAGFFEATSFDGWAPSADPPEPDDAQLETCFSELGNGWKAANITIMATTIAYCVARAALSGLKAHERSPESVGEVVKAISLPAGNAVRLAVGAITAGTGLGTKGNLNVYGKCGVLSGTPAYTGIYGGFGAAARSANTAVVGLVSAGIDALGGVALYGALDVALSAGVQMSIDALAGNTALSGGAGQLDLRGASIAGTGAAGVELHSLGGLVSVAAPTVLIAALAGEACTVSDELGAEPALVASESTGRSYLVGGTFLVTVSGDAVDIGQMGAPGQVDPFKPRISVGHGAVKVAAPNSETGLLLQPDRLVLRNGSKYLKADSKGWSIDADHVDFL